MADHRRDPDVDRGGGRPVALDVPLGSPDRPTWRGRLHLLALASALPAMVALAVAAEGARARAAVVVYGIGLCAMLAVSTIYHRWVHTVRLRAAWRRADHATIFAAIAGTCTAVAVTSLDTGPAIAATAVIWTAAAAGAAVKVIGRDAINRFGPVMYIVLGWAGVALAPAVWSRHGATATALLAAGGVIYTIGALAFRRRWPTLRPATFSYHEIWHAHTVAAAGTHLAAVWVMAT